MTFLAAHPLCARCLTAGRTTAATVVDHITPHRGDPQLFWQPENHQSLCTTCHNSGKQRIEKGGPDTYRGCDANGSPLDPRHGWNAHAA